MCAMTFRKVRILTPVDMQQAHSNVFKTLEIDLDALVQRLNTNGAIPSVAVLGDFADDTAAAAGGVAIGSPYRTGSTIKVRVA
jgi:hypothetical protein